MKDFFKQNKLFLAALLCVFSLGFTSCSDDDDDVKFPDRQLTDMNGTYLGYMKATIKDKLEKNEEEADKGVSVTAIVENDVIKFESLPLDGIITAIVGEEDAPALIAAIGKVGYELPIEKKFDANKENIGLTLAPKNLEFTMNTGTEEEPNEVAVVVTISGTAGNYKYAGTNLTFTISADEVTLDGEKVPTFVSTVLNFDMLPKTK